MTLTPDDREAIDDLLSAYVLALDVGDIDAAVATFLPDGEMTTYGRAFGGDRLRRMFETAPAGMHLTGRSRATAAEHGATVRSQLVFLPADHSERRLAIYDDDVVQVDGKWLFRRRDVRFMDAEGVLQERP